MPHYKLISVADPALSLDLESGDVRAAMHIAVINDLGDAELWCDSKHICTLFRRPASKADEQFTVQWHEPSVLNILKTFSGLEFEVREARPNDASYLVEFWRHVSPDLLASRSIGMHDPTNPNYSAVGPGDRTMTLLAVGGDNQFVAVGILVSDEAGREARVMVFTRDEGTFHGVSWALLEHIILLAKQMGIKLLTSIFDAEDARAIKLEQKMGFVEAQYPGNDRLRILRWTLE